MVRSEQEIFGEPSVFGVREKRGKSGRRIENPRREDPEKGFVQLTTWSS